MPTYKLKIVENDGRAIDALDVEADHDGDALTVALGRLDQSRVEIWRDGTHIATLKPCKDRCT